MARSQTQPEKPTLTQEIISVGGIILTLFLLLCFFSYSLPVQSSAHTPQPAMWGGKIGNIIAQMMMGFLGISAFWVPFLIFVFSIQLFSPRSTLNKVPYLIAGLTGMLISSSALFGALGVKTLRLFGQTYPTGGGLGKFLFGLFSTYFGRPGSVLIFLGGLILSMMLSFRFSLYDFSLGVVGFLRVLKDKYASIRTYLSNRQGKSPKVEPTRKSTSPPIPESEDSKPIVPRVHEPVHFQVSTDEEEEFQLLPVTTGEYQLPNLSLLDKSEGSELSVDKEYYYGVSKELEEKLNDFGVVGKVVGISPGPVITTYEFSPAPGVKINKIVSLADDLALGLKAESVRIVGSIPGKAALGIEIPNPEREIVYVRDIFAYEKFQKSSSKLTIGLGMDVVGNPVVADLAKMPHLLIAGATGSGKSVAVNTIICSILFNASPEEVRLLLVDPKRIELSCYEDIPHLLHPVVVDPKLASRALMWAVREMERRYQVMEEAKVKSLASYNATADTKLPLIVIIIDELADLMMVSSKEVEDSVARLAQMARAAGMHLILATQRPSVDVLTGLIKANFPTRMSFKVSSKIDSRTILDATGAEHLLGAGDMLFMPPGTAKIQRIHGAYISEKEIQRVVTFLKGQGTARYDESVLKIAEEPEKDAALDDEDFDEKYDEAVALVGETGQASISMIQRRLRVGYNRAARMIEVMEREGIVGPADGSKPREVLVRKTY